MGATKKLLKIQLHLQSSSALCANDILVLPPHVTPLSHFADILFPPLSKDSDAMRFPTIFCTFVRPYNGPSYSTNQISSITNHRSNALYRSRAGRYLLASDGLATTDFVYRSVTQRSLATSTIYRHYCRACGNRDRSNLTLPNTAPTFRFYILFDLDPSHCGQRRTIGAGDTIRPFHSPFCQ